jgi:hypothetical protein
MSTPGGAGEILRLAEADPRRTVTLATTVVQQAHAERDFVAESVAERAIGIAATHLEDLHGAVRHLRSAINLANRASSAEQAAEARLRLAFALSIRGRPQQGMREIASARPSLPGPGSRGGAARGNLQPARAVRLRVNLLPHGRARAAAGGRSPVAAARSVQPGDRTRVPP